MQVGLIVSYALFQPGVCLIVAEPRHLQCLAFHPGCSRHGDNSSLTADFSVGECVTVPLEDISFATYIRHHGGVRADGIAQLHSSTKCRCMGGTGTVEANTQDWHWGNGPNP